MPVYTNIDEKIQIKNFSIYDYTNIEKCSRENSFNLLNIFYMLLVCLPIEYFYLNTFYLDSFHLTSLVDDILNLILNIKLQVPSEKKKKQMLFL